MRTTTILLNAVILTTVVFAGRAGADGKAAYSGHGAASVAPEVLAKYAPKPLPAEVSRRIETMLDVRAPGLGLLSPDGKTLVFPWSVTGTSQVWRLDGPKHFPVQLTGGEDQTAVHDVTPDGKRLVVTRDRKGEENPGVYLMDINGGPLEVIQHKAGVQTIYSFISDDGRYLYYRSNDVKPDSYAIYRYDLSAKQAERIFDKEGLWYVADHQPDGRLLLGRETGSLTREFWEWSPQTKTLKPILGTDEKEEYEVKYAAKADEYLVLTNKLGDFRRLYRLHDGKLDPLTKEQPHDVSGFEIDRARAHIYYVVNDNGYTHSYALDAKTYADGKLPPFAGADHVYPGSLTRDGRYALFGVETSRAPRHAFVFDWKTRKLVEWTTPSAPELDTGKFADAKLESYPARDGTRVPMLVRRPEGCEPDGAKAPCPVVVHFHGGPESQSTPGFSTHAQLFVDAGFVFVEPNVRGSDGQGKKWLHADDGPKRLDVITDIEDAGRYVRTAWAKGGRAPKVGIYGGSYGGYSTLVGMTMFAGTYDAGAAVVGMSNLYTFLMNTAPYRRMLRASEYGDPEKDKDALLKLSPITYLDRVKQPLLIIQGASDPRVPVGEALQIHEALAKRGVPDKLIIFPDEGHGAQKRGNRAIQIGEVIAFFEQHLKESVH